MSIYQDGMYIAGKKLGKELCIQKIFDLSKLDHGKYEVVLSDRKTNMLFWLKSEE
jgi:hypothetical protein